MRTAFILVPALALSACHPAIPRRVFQGSGNSSEPASTTRFETVLEEHDASVLRDRRTGYEYLSTAAGITPLLDDDGRPSRHQANAPRRHRHGHGRSDR